MKLIIRADASPEIGAGHVMRCIALGQAWQDSGGQVVFVCVNTTRTISDRILSEGFRLVEIRCESGSVADANEFLRIAADEDASVLVVDHYDCDEKYFEILRRSGSSILTIDDYGHLAEYSMDFVLNQNLGVRDSLYHSKHKNTKLLLGTKFTLLRREFSQSAPEKSVQHKGVRVLVTLGAADPKNALDVVVDGLMRLPALDHRFLVIAGDLNCNYENLIQRASGDHRFEIVKSVSNMPQVYQWADFALCAGGSTNWEMCCYGLPRLVVSLAKNQVKVGKALQAESIGVYLGDAETLTAKKIFDSVRSFAVKTEFHSIARKRSARLVDGMGAHRVIGKLFAARNRDVSAKPSPSVELRRATVEDWEFLLAWRNDPATRAASRNVRPVAKDEHLNWLSRFLANPKNSLLIAESEGTPVGTVRFDRGVPREISWTVAPDWRGKGIGKAMIRKAVDSASQSLRASVRTSNISSRRLAEAVGFELIAVNSDWIEYSLNQKQEND